MLSAKECKGMGLDLSVKDDALALFGQHLHLLLTLQASGTCATSIWYSRYKHLVLALQASGTHATSIWYSRCQHKIGLSLKDCSSPKQHSFSIQVPLQFKIPLEI